MMESFTYKAHELYFGNQIAYLEEEGMYVHKVL
jgi:hypothetical protein